MFPYFVYPGKNPSNYDYMMTLRFRDGIFGQYVHLRVDEIRVIFYYLRVIEKAIRSD